MTTTIAMMMRLLNGTRVIKNGRLRKKNKRSALASCLASIKILGLCMSEDEKRDAEALWK